MVSKKTMITCSIGICVFNEEKNIGKLLNSVLRQRVKSVKITEIIIIASGSTDRTCDIIKTYQRKDRRIKLIRQKHREGKASAVNLFISKAKNEILLLCGGDLILPPSVIEKMTSVFSDSEVGMTGARPIPVNNIEDGFISFAGHLLWDLHHRISMKNPKMGEVVAFRKIFKRIPTTGADEASIEPLIRGQGYQIRYMQNAKIYNKAPTTLREFIHQRRRNYWLHLIILHKQSYLVSTLSPKTIITALISFLADNKNLKYCMYAPLVMTLEVYSRLLGWWDYRFSNRSHTVWEEMKTTKKL